MNYLKTKETLINSAPLFITLISILPHVNYFFLFLLYYNHGWHLNLLLPAADLKVYHLLFFRVYYDSI